MKDLVKKGLEHLQKAGVIWTTILALQYFYSRLKSRYYTRKVAASADNIGKDLKVNGPSRVTTQTELGDNVNFNGLRVNGRGN